MIKFCNGDLLKSDCDIICHQVNLQGVMGGGLALQIATKYPECEQEYRQFVQDGFASLGCVLLWEDLISRKIIANCFSQEPNFSTNYRTIEKCFKSLKSDIAILLNQRRIKIGVPYKYGCGIANGDWEKVLDVFKDIFQNDDRFEFRIYKLQGEKNNDRK